MEAKKALIAIDGTGLGKKVLSKGLELCKDYDLEPVVLYVYEDLFFYGMGGDMSLYGDLYKNLKKDKKQQMKNILKDFSGKFIWKEGEIVEELIKEASKKTYSLLIIGNSGKGFWERFIFGYKLDKVLKNVNKDMLIISSKTSK